MCVCVHGWGCVLEVCSLVQKGDTLHFALNLTLGPLQVLRNHVMVRVGGGWDTLGHYLDKHDPCRCTSLCESLESLLLVLWVGRLEVRGRSDLQGQQVCWMEYGERKMLSTGVVPPQPQKES